MRIIFMGSPDFAVASLQALYLAGHDIVAVFTQPDKPKGRGRELAPTAVKKAALSLGLEVYTPASVKGQDILSLLRQLAPELIVVVAYGKILPPEILFLPKYGSINVHASLLPEFRGAAPIHRAVISGKKHTGITTMHMDVGLDTGDIIYKTNIPISGEDNVGIVHDKLASAGAELIVQTLADIEKGVAPRVKQNEEQATYAGLLTKEDEHINWAKDAKEVTNLVRGMNPFPGSFTFFREENLKTWLVEQEEIRHNANPGTILVSDPKKGLLVACKNNAVWLREVQPKSGKRMGGDAFVRGYKVAVGEILT